MLDVKVTRAMRGAECWTDHRLIRFNLILVVKPKINKMKANPPRRFDDKRLAANPEIQAALIYKVSIKLSRTALEGAEGRPVENCGGDYWL